MKRSTIDTLKQHDFNRRILDAVDHRPWPMPNRPWAMTQTWHNLLFAHWPIDRAHLAAKVPAAFTVDLQSISSQQSQLQTDITNFQQNVITPLQKQLKSEYSQAEILLQQLPTQMAQINQELGFNNSSH